MRAAPALDVAASQIEFTAPSCKPHLYVVIDTEAEFDWSGKFSPNLTGVSAMAGIIRGQRVLERHGVRPVYVIDYPVASQAEGYRPLLDLLARNACEVGAHLHPWTNPPFEESCSNWNSFAGNLPPELEEQKLRVLVQTIKDNLGRSPRFFKAGRYGVGPQTMALLGKLGIPVDFSILPGADLRARGGPDFRGYSTSPQRFGSVLSFPMTRGHVGLLASLPNRAKEMLERPAVKRLRLPGILGKLHLLARVTLTPEGVPAGEQVALIRRLHARDQRIFVLHYHSPSLTPGHTPYGRTEADVRLLLERLSDVCRFFFEELGGVAGDPASLLDQFSLRDLREAHPIPARSQPVPIHPATDCT